MKKKTMKPKAQVPALLCIFFYLSETLALLKTETAVQIFFLFHLLDKMPYAQQPMLGLFI